MKKGYIKIWRKIREHPFYQQKRRFSRLEAWLDLLLRSNWKKGRMIVGGKNYIIPAGSFVVAQRELVKDWGWSLGRVNTYLKFLQKSERSIELKTEQGFSHIFILNWEKYQGDSERKNEQDSEQKLNRKRTQTERIEEGEKRKAAKERNPDTAALLLRERYLKKSGVLRKSREDLPRIEKFLETHPLKDAEEFVEWYLRHPVWGKSPGAICTLFQPQILEEWEKNKKDNEWQYG